MSCIWSDGYPSSGDLCLVAIFATPQPGPHLQIHLRILSQVSHFLIIATLANSSQDSNIIYGIDYAWFLSSQGHLLHFVAGIMVLIIYLIAS